MISAWNLLWIVPIASMFGFWVACMLVCGDDLHLDRRDEWRDL